VESGAKSCVKFVGTLLGLGVQREFDRIRF
jgi:hypothetical protein